MKKPHHTTTAAELMAALRLDSNFIECQQKQGRIHEESVANFHKAELPVVTALETIGLKIRSIGDLTNTYPRYNQAVQILLEHLQKDYPDEVKMAIAYALAYPEAKIAWKILIAKFKEVSNDSPGFKGALAAAIIMTTTDSDIDEVIDLAKDRKHGPTRVILLSALRKSKRPEAKQALKLLATDPDLVKEISSWPKAWKNQYLS